MASHFTTKRRGLFSSGARSEPIDGGSLPAIAFAGELDLLNAEWFEAEIARVQGENPSVVIVARDVTYLDSTILMALLRLHRECTRRNGRLILAEASRPVQRVLNVTGVNRIIGLEESVEQAARAARSRSVA